MSEKPDSAGLTASDEMPQEIQSLIAQCEANVTSFTNDQMSAALHFAEECWRKIVPGEQFVSNDEARELKDILRTLTPSGTALKTSARELVASYESLRRENRSLYPLMREKILREMPLEAERFAGKSATELREILVSAMISLPTAVHPLMSAIGMRLAPPQPTVIEGKGQAVRLPDPVWENAPDDDSVEWKYTNHSATLCCKYWISLRNFKCYQTIHDGSSWCISSAVTCKSLDEAKAVCWEHYLGELGVELEPRPAFVAPEKPELVLVRCSLKSGKQVFWATKNHAGDFVEVGSDNAWGKQYVEILNDKTGEVIA